MPRTTSSLLAAALVAGALLAPASARAAAPWSDPVTVPGSVGQAGVPQVLFTRTRGGAVFFNGPGEGFAQPLLRSVLGDGLAPLPATAAKGATGLSTADGAFAAGDRMIYVGSNGKQRVSLGVASGRQADWAAVLRGPATAGARVAAAAAPHGGAAAVFSTFGAGGRGRVYLVRQVRTRAPSATQTLSATGAIRAVGVGVNAAGDVLVAWDRSGHLEARFWIAASQHLTAVQQLGTTTTGASHIAVALGDGRRATVAWIDQHVDEGEAAQGKVMATARTATRGFGAPKQLDTYGVNQIPGGKALDAAYTGSGRGVIAWGGSTAIRAALVDGATIGAPADLAPVAADNDRQDVGLGDLATSPAGQAVVTWVIAPDNDNLTQVMAAPLAAGASAFGPAEAVSPLFSSVDSPSAGFDPVSGRAVIAWRQLSQLPGPPPELDVAQRPAP